jgi:hypothetical protein
MPESTLNGIVAEDARNCKGECGHLGCFVGPVRSIQKSMLVGATTSLNRWLRACSMRWDRCTRLRPH